MKRLVSLLLALIIMIVLCGCQGNFGSVNLADPIEIPEDGIIRESVIRQLKDLNAIGVFVGNSGEYKYEWTVFGSDVDEAGDVNLGLELSKTAQGDIQVILQDTGVFGFSALLSIYTGEQWDARSATAYVGDQAFASVSVTGGKSTILNIALDGAVDHFTICPDKLPEEEQTTGATEIPNGTQSLSAPTHEQDDYLSNPTENDHRVYNGGKDAYLTDPVPEGKPQPVEPENQEVDERITYTCTFFVECSTILNNLEMVDRDKLEMIPTGGVILDRTTVTFYEGESVFDVLQRVCRDNGIHMEASWTPIYNSAYVEGIHNLYEFDCGNLSGWMYRVNGWYPNYGSSRYELKDGDVVEWRYTCDLGNDIGGSYAVGG